MKYYPPNFDSLEDYQKDLKSMAILAWGCSVFLAITIVGFFLAGWKVAPWICLGALLFQNIPLAMMYSMRYKWSLEDDLGPSESDLNTEDDFLWSLEDEPPPGDR